MSQNLVYVSQAGGRIKYSVYSRSEALLAQCEKGCSLRAMPGTLSPLDADASVATCTTSCKRDCIPRKLIETTAPKGFVCRFYFTMCIYLPTTLNFLKSSWIWTRSTILRCFIISHKKINHVRKKSLARLSPKYSDYETTPEGYLLWASLFRQVLGGGAISNSQVARKLLI